MTNDCGLKPAETDGGGEKKMYSLEIARGWQRDAEWTLRVRLNVVMWICVRCINRGNAWECSGEKNKHVQNIYFSIFSYFQTYRNTVLLYSKERLHLKDRNHHCLFLLCVFLHMNRRYQMKLCIILNHVENLECKKLSFSLNYDSINLKSTLCFYLYSTTLMR